MFHSKIHPWIKYCFLEFQLSDFKLSFHQFIFGRRKSLSSLLHMGISAIRLKGTFLPIYFSHLMSIWTQISFNSKFKRCLEIHLLPILLLTFLKEKKFIIIWQYACNLQKQQPIYLKTLKRWHITLRDLLNRVFYSLWLNTWYGARLPI